MNPNGPFRPLMKALDGTKHRSVQLRTRNCCAGKQCLGQHVWPCGENATVFFRAFSDHLVKETSRTSARTAETIAVGFHQLGLCPASCRAAMDEPSSYNSICPTDCAGAHSGISVVLRPGRAARALQCTYSYSNSPSSPCECEKSPLQKWNNVPGRLQQAAPSTGRPRGSRREVN